MSGPEYPRGPLPGSNAIGSFIIGESPIGTIPAFDRWQTIISQYANSPVLTQLLTDFFECVDQTANMDAFFDQIWNVDTAVGHGLDVWGRIVGIGRTLQLPNTDEYVGFQEAAEPNYFGFGQAPFYNGDPLTDNFDLSDAAYRVLIFAKALANISDGSIRSINQLLHNLFPSRGNAYVADNLDMTMTYTFEFFLSAVELAIVQTSGALPKPVGVSADVEQGLVV